MTGWLAALRIARREARRGKGRSALVVALIALPVAALSFAAVSYDSFRLTTEQQLRRGIGDADAELVWQIDAPIEQPVDGQGYAADGEAPPRGPATPAELLAVLPAGSRVVPVHEGQVEMRTAGGVGRLDTEATDLADPVHAGRVALHAGRFPAGPGEVALTRRAGERLGATVGDRAATADAAASWQVVGIVEYPARFGERIVLHPDAVDPRLPPGLSERPSWLLDAPAPVSWEQVRQLNRHGIQVRSRAVLRDPPPPEQRYPTWREDRGDPTAAALGLGTVAGGLALLEVVLLAGPAFAIGARRRQRQLALVAATGGTPGHLRRIVLADGVVLGAAAAVAGVTVGATAALAGLPLLEEYLVNRRAGGARLWPAALLGIAGLAVLTGLAAALVPAVTAARRPVVAVLAGRPAVLTRRRWPVLGLLTTAAGAAVAALGAQRRDTDLILAGLVLMQLGVVVATPALLGLIARAAGRLPLPLRIAVRDSGRNRAAVAPAVSAVMAAVAGAVTVGAFLGSEEARYHEFYQPVAPVGQVAVPYETLGIGGQRSLPSADQAAVRRALAETLGPAPVVEVPGVGCPATGEAADGAATGSSPSGSDPTRGAPGSATLGMERTDQCGITVPQPARNQCPWQFDHPPASDAERERAEADPRCGGLTVISGSPYDTVVDDGRLVGPLTGADPTDAAAATEVLRSGGVVVADPLLVVDGQATVEVMIESSERAPRRITVPAHALTTGTVSPLVEFVSPDLVEASGLVVRPAAAVALADSPPDQRREDALLAALRQVDADLQPYVERGVLRDRDPDALGLAVIAAIVALGAAAIATGLVGADRRPDLSTLAAVGASPSVRRLLSVGQALVVAGLGTGLGVIAGLAGAAALNGARNQGIAEAWPPLPPYPLVVPWPVLLVLAAVPVVAVLGAGLFTRARLPVELRRG